MQRQLVLEANARRHPFRLHMRRVSAVERKLRDDSDIKLFVLSFTAFFVCFYTFIA
ncbi:hypothetical protein IAG41_00560 [Sphingomonas sp. JC676]|uniref:hypothetical protein n=1 Tax=Sphingomonas sp. JC676 TaxID=2768065 RepID=UPI0016579B86|nr:hypothetical protein [Sphingomonas sp. JC676]MBC9030872.1 hypothetical protein [Sphingomonas sp. JC676]